MLTCIIGTEQTYFGGKTTLMQLKVIAIPQSVNSFRLGVTEI